MWPDTGTYRFLKNIFYLCFHLSVEIFCTNRTEQPHICTFSKEVFWPLFKKSMPHIGPVFADIRYPTRDPTGISCTGTRPARFWISQIMWLDIRCFPRVLIYYTGTFIIFVDPNQNSFRIQQLCVRGSVPLF